MSKRESIEMLYTDLGKAKTGAEIGRILAELRALGVNIPEPRPVNGASGPKSAGAERTAVMMMRHIHRLCAAIPYGESSWCYGYVHGVAYDTEDGTCLYTIHLDDTRRIVKRYGSESFRLLDGHKNFLTDGALEQIRREEGKIEADRESLKAAKEYTGYMVELEGLGAVRIMSVVKSRAKIMYRVRTQDGEILYRYPKPGLKYWSDGETEAVAGKSRSRTLKKELDLSRRLAKERELLDKVERIAEEYRMRAESHRANIEALKAEMAAEYGSANAETGDNNTVTI